MYFKETKKTIIILATLLFIITGCKSSFIGNMLDTDEMTPFFNKDEENKKPGLPNFKPVMTPKHLSSTEGHIDQITLTWDYSEEVKSYNIYYAKKELGSYQKLKSEYIDEPDLISKTISFSDLGEEHTLLSSIKYFYKVTALNEDGIESGYSNISKGFCYLSNATLQPPLEIFASKGDFIDTIEIRWNRVPNAISYLVYRSTEKTGPFLDPIATVTTLSFSDADLELKETDTYYYTIQAENIAGEKSPHSIAISGFLASAALPSTIENLNATKGDNQNSITVTWDRVQGISKYAIYRSNQKDGIYSKINEIIIPSGIPTYIDSDVSIADELNHYYKIKCFNNSNQYGAISASYATGWVTKAAPVITLLGDNPLIIDLTAGDEYVDPRTTTIDNIDGDISFFVTADESSIDPTKRGTYNIIYSVSDRAGNYCEATRVVKVVANINSQGYELTKSLIYPASNKDVTYLISGLSANSQGGDIEYSWKFNTNSPIETNTINDYTTTLPSNTYQLKVIASNLDDKKIFTIDFRVYEPCTEIINGNFENGSDVAPWLWDIDNYWDVPSGATGWADAIQDSSSNHKERKEQVTNLIDGKGINSSKAAIICDTTANTGTFWNIPDIVETSGKLYTTFSIISGPEYKFEASIYRGEHCSTPIKCTLKSNIDLNTSIDGIQNSITVDIPSSKGWNNIEIILKPESAGDIVLEFFKGTDWRNSDEGEVRFDNILLTYNN